MSIKGSSRPQAAAWSQKAKDWLARQPLAERARQFERAATHVSALHNGRRITTDWMVQTVRIIAQREKVALSPADLGRPDLARGGRQ